MQLNNLTVAVALVFVSAAPAQTPIERDLEMRLRRTPVVEVFEANRNAVVNISSTSIVRARRSKRDVDQLLDELFDVRRRRPTEFRQDTIGSGFVIHERGYIVTNAHVVSRTTERHVVFADGKTLDADIVALDQAHDLAILKVDAPRPLPTVRLGRSNDVLVGETVVAIGNPLGFQHTVTSGIVSAINRNVEIGKDQVFRGLIQTDASINPGNSGGPLLNAVGDLIGINTAIRGDAQNIGFAIPVARLRELMPQLLGIEENTDFKIGLHIAPGERVVVQAVDDESPAATADLHAGDLITAIGGVPVKGQIDYFVALIEGLKRGPVPLHVAYERNGAQSKTELQIELGPHPDGAALAAARFGLKIRPIRASESVSFSLRPDRGLIIDGVTDGSPADDLGIERGDVLLRIGRYDLNDLDQVGRLLEFVQPGDAVDVTLLREARGRIWLIEATLVAADDL